MNHIYKVIFCKTTGTFAAVAETAKSHGKTHSQTKGINMPSSSNGMAMSKTMLASAISALMLIMSGQVFAADQTVTGNLIVTGNTVVDGTLTVGGNTVATRADLNTKADQSALDATNSKVTANTNALATKADKTALDTTNQNVTANTAAIATKANQSDLNITNSNITGLQNSLNNLGVSSTSGGIKYFRTNSTEPDAVATGINAVAIGPNSVANAKDSLAIGGSSIDVASERTIAIGKGSKIGVNSRSAVVIGDGATVSNSANSIAMGTGARTASTDAIALGSSSLAGTANSIALGNAAQANPGSTISIGSAAGAGQVVDVSATNRNHINIGVAAGQGVNGQGNIAIGTNAGRSVIGQASVAIGNNAGNNLVTEYNSLAENVSIGNNANTYLVDASIQYATAVGSRTIAKRYGTAVGYNAKADAINATAVGYGSQANGADSLALGNNTVAAANNVALGSNSVAAAVPNAVNGYLTGMSSQNIVSVGSGTNTGVQYRRIVNVADGVENQDVATIAQLKQTQQNVVQTLTPLIQASNGAAPTGIYYDTVPTNGTSSITLKPNTTVGNVAAGVNNNDATNLEQVTKMVETAKPHFFSWTGDPLSDKNYNNGGATGTLSLAVGQNTGASKERSIAFGNNTSSDQEGSIAIGTQYIYDATNGIDYFNPNINVRSSPTVVNDNNGRDKYSMAIGAGANSQGSNSIAIGSLAATGYRDINVSNSVDRAIAIGYAAHTTNQSGTAIGSLAQVTGKQSIALGAHTLTEGQNSGNIGFAGDIGTTNRTRVNANETYAIGNRNGHVNAAASQVLGNDNVVNQYSNNLVMAGNYNTVTTAVSATSSIGRLNTVSASNASLQGNNNSLTGNNSQIVGNKNTVSGDTGIAIGTSNTVSGTQSISIGTGNRVTGNKSGVLGDPSYVSGTGTYTVGNDNGTSASPITANNAGAFGNNNMMTGDNSRVIGNNNNVSTTDTFVLGNGIGTNNTANGSTVVPTVTNSVYLGSNTTAVSASGNNVTSSNAVGSTTTGGATDTVNTATVNGLIYTGFAGATSVGAVTVGAAGAERRISNVAAGQISSTSTDAINGSQLYLTQQTLGNVASSTKNVLGGNATLSNDGTISMSNIGGTGKNNVDDAIKAATTKVAGGAGNTVTQTLNADGSSTYTVSTKVDGVTTKIDTNGNVVAVTSPLTNTANGTINTPIAPNALATAGDVAQAVNNAGFNLQANGDTASLVKTGNTVQFINGNNIDITRNGNNITVATKPNLVADSLSINNSGVQLDVNGLDNGGNKITNVAAGINDTDAVNVSQLNAVANNVKTSSITRGTNIASVTSNTVGNNTEYTINANGTTASAGSSAVTVTKGTTDANNVTDYSVDLSQASKNSLAKADSALQTVVTQIDGKEVKTIDQANNTANFVSGDNMMLSDDGNGGIKVSTAKDVNFNNVTANDSITAGTGANQVLLNNNGVSVGGNNYINANGLNANNQTISNVATGINDTDAVNLSQLKNTVGSAVAASKEEVKSSNNTIKVATTQNANGANVYDVSVNTGTSLKVDNITGAIDVKTDGTTITQNADGALQVATTTLTPTTNGAVTAGNNSSLVTAGSVANAINNSGFNLTTSASAGIVAGTTTELINPGKTVTIDAGKNIAITQNGNNISVATKDDMELSKVTANTVVVGSPTGNNTTLTSTANGLDVGGDKITNVGIGTAPTDVATVGQLTEVKAGKNVTVTAATGNNGQTIYTIDSMGSGGASVTANNKVTSNNIINGQGTTITTNDKGDIQINSPLAYTGNTTTTDTATATNTVKLMGKDGAVQVSNMQSGVYDPNAPFTSPDDHANRINMATGDMLNNAANISDVQAVSNNLQHKINDLGYKMGDIEDNANAGISGAMAMAALPQAYLPGKSMVAGGMASYNGQGAAAIGVSKLSDNGRWVIKVNGTADTQGNYGGAVGAGFHW